MPRDAAQSSAAPPSPATIAKHALDQALAAQDGQIALLWALYAMRAIDPQKLHDHLSHFIEALPAPMRDGPSGEYMRFLRLQFAAMAEAETEAVAELDAGAGGEA